MIIIVMIKNILFLLFTNKYIKKHKTTVIAAGQLKLIKTLEEIKIKIII